MIYILLLRSMMIILNTHSISPGMLEINTQNKMIHDRIHMPHTLTHTIMHTFLNTVYCVYCTLGIPYPKTQPYSRKVRFSLQKI